MYKMYIRLYRNNSPFCLSVTGNVPFSMFKTLRRKIKITNRGRCETHGCLFGRSLLLYFTSALRNWTRTRGEHNYQQLSNPGHVAKGFKVVIYNFFHVYVWYNILFWVEFQTVMSWWNRCNICTYRCTLCYNTRETNNITLNIYTCNNCPIFAK